MQQQLGRIEALLTTLTGKVDTIMAVLDDLKAQVAASVGVEQSALTLIHGLHDQLVAAGTDPTALQALQQQLKDSADALAAAVATP